MNPLFKKFAQAMKKADQMEGMIRLAQKATSGKGAFTEFDPLRNVIGAARSGKSGFRDLEQVRKGFRDVNRAMKSGDKMSYGRLSQFIKDTIFNEMMRQLGPLGSVISAMIRPSARAMTADIEKELKAAADLLTQFGYQVIPPVEQTGSGIGLGTPTFAPAQPAPPLTPSRRPATKPEPLVTEGETIGERQRTPEGPQSNYLTVNVNGQRFRIRRDDPLLTGQMIRVKSSNVHSIGYIWNDDNPAKGTLQVRYLDHRKGRGANRAGAGYQYFEVHPAVFVAFTKAASKGKFVWDRLRIRGTVSGHQYTYSIATLASDGYVPRKARRVGGEEWYLRRAVKGTNGQVYESKLPERMVGTYNPRPNRGQPNRGTPNRGR